MSLSRDEILRRASRLAKMTTASGCSLAEAEAAAERLGNLLRENNLSMQEVSAAELAAEMSEEIHDTGKTRVAAWIWDLVTCLSSVTTTQANFLNPGLVRMPDGSIKRLTATFKFIGHQADASVAAYFLGYLLQALPDLARRRKPMNRDAYLTGCVISVCERLRRMIDPIGDTAGPNALSLAKREAISAWVEKTTGKLPPRCAPSAIDRDRTSRIQGQIDGKAINLHFALPSAPTAPRRLEAHP